jgi:type II secretion system protein N
MTPVDIAENEAPDVIYESRFSFKFKLFTITFVVFILTLFYTLSLKSTLSVVLEKQLKNNSRCPIDYQDIKLGFFLPSISLDKPKISGRCFGRGRSDVPLDLATVKVLMPSLWPPGIKTHIQLKKGKSTINIYPKLSPFGHDVRITKTKIDGAFLSSMSAYPNLLTGQITLEANVKIEKNTIVKGDIKAESNNLNIPSQTIAGFNLMNLNLNTLQMAGSITRNKFKLKALKVGSSSAPIEAQFLGSIDLAKSNIRYSKLALNGKVRFSDEFLENVSILSLFISGKKREGNFYPISIGGTLAVPKPQFLSP